MSKEQENLFREITIRWTFENRVMAGIPANEKLIDKWLEVKKASDPKHEKMESPKSLEDLGGEVKDEMREAFESVPEEAGALYLGFKRNSDKELYLESYQVKAHLKDCCRVLGNNVLSSTKSLRSKFADRVFVTPEHIPMMKHDGTVFQGSAPIEGSWFDHPIHVWSPGVGQRSALKANEYVEGGSYIDFTLKILDDNLITDKIIYTLMDYGKEHGFMSERGLGYGTYSHDFEI